MHQSTVQSLCSLLLIGTLTHSLAAGPALGVAMASGSFHVGTAEVKGNASLFDGSEIRTGSASSKLRFSNGARMELGTGAQALVRTDRVVLQRGAGQVQGGGVYGMDARTLRILPLDTQAIARVQLDGANAVLVSAVNGPVRVTTASGVLLARLEAGGNLRFEPQSGSSADAVDVSGCLLKKNGQVILVEAITNQIFEVRGADQSGQLGNRVRVKGTGVVDPKAVAGAPRIIQSSEVTLIGPGLCLGVAGSVKADPLPGATVVAGAAGAAAAGAAGAGAAAGGAAAGTAAAGAAAGISTGVIIAGVAVGGGAAVAIPLALSSKSKSQ